MREAVETGILPTKSPLEWAVRADGILYTATDRYQVGRQPGER